MSESTRSARQAVHTWMRHTTSHRAIPTDKAVGDRHLSTIKHANCMPIAAASRHKQHATSETRCRLADMSARLSNTWCSKSLGHMQVKHHMQQVERAPHISQVDLRLQAPTAVSAEQCYEYSSVQYSAVLREQYSAMSTVQCYENSTVLWVQYSAMRTVQCYEYSTVLWVQYSTVQCYSAMSTVQYYENSTVLWVQYGAMITVQCYEYSTVLWVQYSTVQQYSAMITVQCYEYSTVPKYSAVITGCTRALSTVLGLYCVTTVEALSL